MYKRPKRNILIEWLTGEVLREGTTNKECMLWPRAIQSLGYGVFRHHGKTYYAHIVAYELVKGEIPEGMKVDHTCHNESVEKGECEGGGKCVHRRCFNPAHLELASNQENCKRGVKLKLSDEDIIQVRKMFSEGMFQTEIACLFNVDSSTISRIVNNKRRNSGEVQ